MPNYGTLPLTGAGTGVAATTLFPGDQMTLFNAESPTATQQSIAVSIARGSRPNQSPGLEFTTQAASGTVDILGSNVDTPASYQKLFTATNLAAANYSDAGKFAFYSCQLSAGTGPVTVIVQA